MLNIYNILNMYDSSTSEFKKTIGITEEDLNWIKKVKKKKSAAGFLKEILAKYREQIKQKTSL